jgi:UV DNA damage endonuclease
MQRADALRKVSDLCLGNARSLRSAFEFCVQNQIGDFRINSEILPVKTHPQVGYDIGDLPDCDEIVSVFRACGAFALEHDLRVTFHPDQFVLLSSDNPDVISRSVADLVYQAEVAQWVGADVINIHGGGAYGNKEKALDRVRREVDRLPEAVRTRLTFENDDRTYTPSDLLPLCRDTGVPLVYDVHHHRCLPDGCSVEEMTEAAVATWNREPLFHLSSPKDGWDSADPKKHHDFIDPDDFPECWLPLDATVEVEAKAKEVAIAKLVRGMGLMVDG